MRPWPAGVANGRTSAHVNGGRGGAAPAGAEAEEAFGSPSHALAREPVAPVAYGSQGQDLCDLGPCSRAVLPPGCKCMLRSG